MINKQPKNSQDEQVTNFFRNVFFPFFDVLPPLKRTEVISFKQRIVHTIMGFIGYISLIIIPFAGFFKTTTNRKFNMIFADASTNLCASARTAITASALVSQLVFSYLVKSKDTAIESEAKKESISRGVRNFMIIVAIFLARPYTLFFDDLPNNALVFLGRDQVPLDWIIFMAIVFMQNIIVSILAIFVDDYLLNYSIGGQHRVTYYQFAEVLIIFFFADPLINYVWWRSVLGIFMIIVIKVISDQFFKITYTIEHCQQKGITRKFALKTSSVILNASYILNFAKKAINNTFLMIIKPGYNYLISINYLNKPYIGKVLLYLKSNSEYYLGQDFYLKIFNKLDISNNIERLLASPLINEYNTNWTLLPFIDDWMSLSALTLILNFLVELAIIMPLAIYLVRLVTPELQGEQLARRLRNNDYKIQGVMANENAIAKVINAKLKILIYYSMLQNILLEGLITFIPVYGNVIKSFEIAHIYNLVRNIADNLKEYSKTEKESLPAPLNTVAKYID